MKLYGLYMVAALYILLTFTMLAFQASGREDSFVTNTQLFLTIVFLLGPLTGDLRRYDKYIQTRLTELSDRIDCLSNRGKEDGDTNKITPGTDEE